MENYLMLNGKRIDLTAEQIETLVGKKEKDPFDVTDGDTYYWINGLGQIVRDFYSEGCLATEARVEVANACTDAKLMEQRALHKVLDDLLFRYSMQHGGREIKWNSRDNWRIVYSHTQEDFHPYNNDDYQTIGAVYFKEEETANAAIEEIVKPFMEQHPEFRW